MDAAADEGVLASYRTLYRASDDAVAEPPMMGRPTALDENYDVAACPVKWPS